MAELIFRDGDATLPIKDDGIIIHVCNDVGKWGKGFVLALSKRSKAPEKAYREWASGTATAIGKPFELGQVQRVRFYEDEMMPDNIVMNMVAQRDIYPIDGIPPLRYDALEECLKTVYAQAEDENRTVHLPRIGCGLAGGDWDEVEKILRKTMTVDTYVYDYDE